MNLTKNEVQILHDALIGSAHHDLRARLFDAIDTMTCLKTEVAILTDVKDSPERQVAKLLIEAARKGGAAKITTFSDIGGELLCNTNVDAEIVDSMVDDCEEVFIEFLDATGKRLNHVLFIPGNGFDAFSDCFDNSWYLEHLDPLFAKIEALEAEEA